MTSKQVLVASGLEFRTPQHIFQNIGHLRNCIRAHFADSQVKQNVRKIRRIKKHLSMYFKFSEFCSKKSI